MSTDPDSIAPRLRQTLPPGRTFSASPASYLYKLLLAAADELARVYDRTDDLLLEQHPATATETLNDWEAEYALPEPGYPALTDIDQRRAAIASKAFNALGGQSRQYFIDVAAGLGVTITITEPRPFELGICGMGDPIGEFQYRFYWYVYLPAGSAATLQPVFERLKPAHTQVFFYED